jgi:alpha-glucosidase
MTAPFSPRVSHHRIGRAPSLAVCAALCLLAPAAHTQTLAQKNWAGSGVSTESWWRRGVFYRIDPARFQSSDNTPTGDLLGLSQRLDYIQSLGVDAILLAPSPTDPPLTPNTPGWDDLARAAADHHLRLVLALPAPASQAPAADAKVLALARAWLTQGVAGLSIPLAAIAQVDGAEHIGALLRQLHALAATFPGERILLSEAPPPNAESPVTRALAQNIQLTMGPAIDLTQPTAAILRAQLTTALNTPTPLLSATRATQSAPALDRTVATLLLASRSAVVLDFGEELGLIPSDSKTAPLMQWTPSNHTPPPPPPPPPPAVYTPPPPDESFKPYVPPLPRNFFPPPPMPIVIPVEHPENPRLEPNAQRGFTAGALPAPTSLNGDTANVALEDTDPASLLSLYRRLIQLHHDNASLRNGTQTLLDHDADDALVWLRPAPANSRVVGSAVVACNLSARPLTLDLNPLHLRAATLRTLLGDTPATTPTTLTLSPHTVFLGETSR